AAEIVTGHTGGSRKLRSIARADAEVKRRNAGPVRRTLQCLRMAQRADSVVVTGPPVVAHAQRRKFVVLGLFFVALGPIDQVDNTIDLAIGERAQEPAFLVVEPFGWHLLEAFG